MRAPKKLFPFNFNNLLNLLPFIFYMINTYLLGLVLFPLLEAGLFPGELSEALKVVLEAANETLVSDLAILKVIKKM